MEFRLEHYRVITSADGLRIIQDQHRESRKALVFAVLLMLTFYAFGPLGWLTLQGHRLDWMFFGAFEIGLLVSLAVITRARSYTKEHQFYADRIRVIEYLKNTLISDQTVAISPPLKAERMYHHTTPGSDGPNAPIFAWTLHLDIGETDTLELVSGKKATMDRLIDSIQKLIPLEVRDTHTRGTFVESAAHLLERRGRRKL